jgi:hypothetical protein
VEVEQEYTLGYNRVPVGLAMRLVSDTLYHEQMPIELPINFSGKRNKYIDGVRSLCARAYLNRAIYESFFNKKELILANLNRALDFEPTLSEAQMMKAQLTGKN